MRMLRRLASPGLALFALLLALAGAQAWAQALQPVPPLSGRVIDRSATLTAEQQLGLEARLAAVEREFGSQIVVLMLPSTQPEDIAAYAQRVGEAWKLGRREVGDGLLIVVAKDDRRMRIEVAKALEGAVPDLAAKRIIDRQLAPAFRAGDYAGGLNAAVDALAARLGGEGLPEPSRPAAGTQWPDLAIFLLMAVPVVGSVLTGMVGRKAGSLLTGLGAGGLAWFMTASLAVAGVALLLALLLVGVMGVGAATRGGRGGPIVWGGGHGGSSGWRGGGGGFSSGGGGDFGGGGASGDW